MIFEGLNFTNASQGAPPVLRGLCLQRWGSAVPAENHFTKLLDYLPSSWVLFVDYTSLSRTGDELLWGGVRVRERWRDSKRYSSVADGQLCPLVPHTLIDPLEAIWSVLMFLLLQFPCVGPDCWNSLKEGSREIVGGGWFSTIVQQGARSFPKGLTVEWSLCSPMKQVKTLSQLRLPVSTIYILPITVVLCVWVCVFGGGCGVHEKGQRTEPWNVSIFLPVAILFK